MLQWPAKLSCWFRVGLRNIAEESRCTARSWDPGAKFCQMSTCCECLHSGHSGILVTGAKLNRDHSNAWFRPKSKRSHVLPPDEHANIPTKKGTTLSTCVFSPADERKNYLGRCRHLIAYIMAPDFNNMLQQESVKQDLWFQVVKRTAKRRKQKAAWTTCTKNSQRTSWSHLKLQSLGNISCFLPIALLRAEFVRELLREQDELQERLQEIEETLNLFRSQPAYWDISSLSMAREASESLLERIEQAQEDRKGGPKIRCFQNLPMCSIRLYWWRISLAFVFEKPVTRTPRASTRRRSPWSERRQIIHKSIDTPWTSTPSTRFGQLFWAQLY